MKRNLSILTPEGIEFSHTLATPVSRCLAWCIDMACIAACTSVAGTLLSVAGVLSADVAQALTIVSYFVIGVGYGILMEWLWRGQTIGKRMLRLRVIDQQGLRIRFNQIVMRNLLRFVDILPACYLLGGLCALFHPRMQRLGDIAAGTLVISTPPLAEPDLSQISPGKFNSLRQHAHLAARLRQRISPEQAAICLQALLRRDELTPADRLAVFADLAEFLKSEVTFPDEAIETLTDEQYVRNAVDILYRTNDAIAKRNLAPAAL
jgi:uncharacterized RDD family membrane protein YckC